MLPFDTWKGEDSPLAFGKLCALATLVILFRRLPAVLLLRKGLPSIKKFGEVIFVGKSVDYTDLYRRSHVV